MPRPRGAATRGATRRNSQQDDTPSRTRGQAAKQAPSEPDAPDTVAPAFSPTKLSPTITRKTTRSASNISGNSFEAPSASEIYASYEHPLFMVFGLSPEFFDGLKKHHGKLPKERKSIVGALPERSPTPEEASESEDESAEESEVEVPVAPPPAPRGRGRGGRGSRGGRGRGGRGRGSRGGRGRGGTSRGTSSAPSKASRNAAMFPLTEDDDDQPSNQSTPNGTAKPSMRLLNNNRLHSSDDENEEAIEDDESEAEYDRIDVVQKPSRTPQGSAPPGQDSLEGGSHTSAPARESRPEPTSRRSTKLAVPKIALPESASQTPRDSASTPAESAVPRLLEPEEDMLSESDLPDPFIEDAPSPIEAECEDRADYLLQKRFKPMTDVQAAIAALTKFPAAQRSTENLYALTQNTQQILKAWQDEYLVLDARTAPHMHPAKKACNGGRIPLAPEVFEDMKEADLYGYIYDPKKPPGCQDPFLQRPGADKGGKRELRTRRTRDQLESAAPSEEEDEEDGDGRPSKRQRRATRKFDGTDTGTGANTPKKHNGWGGARKKGVSRFAKPTSETPEPEGRGVKRARTTASNLLHQRIQEMREESVVGSSGDEDSSTMDVDEYSDANPKRGRPAGSKNVARRSDFGVKKGPRKKTSESGTPAPSAHGPNAPPPALNSMSEGQGQFTIDAQPFPEGIPIMAPNSAETVFQGTLQYSAPSTEVPLVHPSESSTPDAYMLTAPLSQYTAINSYADDSSPASGSRRKPRVKSEKRSQSMTMWWAERKAKKREEEAQAGITPTPDPREKSATQKGARQSEGSATGATPQSQPSHSQQASPIHHPQHAPQHSPHHPPPEAYLQYTQGPPQHYMYLSGPPPPQHMMMQYSPLAALPTGSFPSPYPHHAPHAHSGIPLTQPPSTAGGPFGGPRQLAPAPMNMPTYPSPYGPQSPAGGRPKSSGQSLPRSAATTGQNGQQVLAPAPSQQQHQQQQGQHFSPYAPMNVGGAAGREMPFKVMVPGPAPERRGSR
ncbi:hypothetical protein J4E86_001413 [Alternaria arbusti]|uniref:uncharacterized protein n=1 Tax=Alternaria arbusti TaxID=232088 RepID=UPI0022210B99|nr:uncharacterized protein J4E86_001413 [Alternaria arbusti]KAI4962379.1 hypothetical protein J4E86_001413 [Alternaria arbusti]